MVNALINAQFTYDHNGLRVKKAVNGITTDYVLNGNNIAHMTCGNDELHFFYDAQDRAAMVRYNGADYFYVYNLQGDVVALVDVNGAQMVEYVYDAWGNLISKSGSMATTLGTENPFRYRGYIYDEETELYYVNDRYYNAHVFRFLNEDQFISTRSGRFSTNMYAYCENSPIARKDHLGTKWGNIVDRVKKGAQKAKEAVSKAIKKVVGVKGSVSVTTSNGKEVHKFVGATITHGSKVKKVVEERGDDSKLISFVTEADTNIEDGISVSGKTKINLILGLSVSIGTGTEGNEFTISKEYKNLTSETSFSSSNFGFGIESSVSESQPDGSELVTYSSVEVNFMDFLAEAASFMLSMFDYMPIYETLWVY